MQQRVIVTPLSRRNLNMSREFWHVYDYLYWKTSHAISKNDGDLQVWYQNGQGTLSELIYSPHNRYV